MESVSVAERKNQCWCCMKNKNKYYSGRAREIFLKLLSLFKSFTQIINVESVFSTFYSTQNSVTSFTDKVAANNSQQHCKHHDL